MQRRNHIKYLVYQVTPNLLHVMREVMHWNYLLPVGGITCCTFDHHERLAQFEVLIVELHT